MFSLNILLLHAPLTVHTPIDSCRLSVCRCTLNPSDQMALEGPLSRVKSIKKSLRQSFRRIRRSRVSMRKHHTTNAAKVCRSRRGVLHALLYSFNYGGLMVNILFL